MEPYLQYQTPHAHDQCRPRIAAAAAAAAEDAWGERPQGGCLEEKMLSSCGNQGAKAKGRSKHGGTRVQGTASMHVSTC